MTGRFRWIGGSFLGVAACFLWLARSAGRLLVIDAPRRGDAILVLAGDHNDHRYRKGLELLRAGYARLVLVDANSDWILFGRPVAGQEADYIQRTEKVDSKRISVCPIVGDSTAEETSAVGRCLTDRNVSSILLVTSDFHTRRALSVFQARLPGYRWSVAAARDESIFGTEWWQRREWAKTLLLECTKLGWWELVERWQSSG